MEKLTSACILVKLNSQFTFVVATYLLYETNALPSIKYKNEL